MRKITVLLVGAAGGAAAAALLDPSLGRSRRAYLSQRIPGLARQTADRTERGMRAANAQINGLTQKLQHLTPEDQHPDDQRLLDRVQSELFRSADIPKGDLNVNVENGTVVLRGHVADDSVKQQVETRARSISGVERVENLINVS